MMLTNVPTYERYLGIGPDVITLVILGVCVCAATGSALSGWFAARFGSARVVTGGLLVAAAGILAVGLSAGPGARTVLPRVRRVRGRAGLGRRVDVHAGHRRAARVRAQPHRVVLRRERCRRRGRVARRVGAAAVDLPLPVSLALVAVVVGVAVMVLRPGLLSRAVAVAVAGQVGCPTAALPFRGRVSSRRWPGRARWSVTQGRGTVPQPVPACWSAPEKGHSPRGTRGLSGMVGAGTVIVLGVAMLAFPVADSAVSSWGATFLQDVLGASDVVGPLGFGAYQATLICSRLLGDRAVERWGACAWSRSAGPSGSRVWHSSRCPRRGRSRSSGSRRPGWASGSSRPWPSRLRGPGGGVGRVRHGGADGWGLTGGWGTGAPADGEPPVVSSVEEATDRAVARLNIFTYVGAVLGGAMTGIFATTDALRAGFGCWPCWPSRRWCSRGASARPRSLRTCQNQGEVEGTLVLTGRG
ncbi:hypothetical protein NKG05_04280 [Oerskovia sp. M15]